MANKIMGILLILIAAVLGIAFYKQMFRLGFDEGLSRMVNMKFEQAMWGIGSIFGFIVGVSALFKKKKSPPDSTS